MKVVVFAHRLEVGGTQVNAIDLATGLRDRHGFEVVLFATPGPLVRLVQERGLRYVEAPDAILHPSLARMKALRRLVREEKPDLIHAWDWWQCLDAYYSVHLPMGVPMVVSDMMMELTRILPKQVWTTFGIPDLVEVARRVGRRKVDLILPPVDVQANAAGAVDAEPFRRRYAQGNELLVVTVSRLAVFMKSESLIRTIASVQALGRQLPLKFVIVGDGAARPRVERLAAETNAVLGREAVVCTGALLDPRPAYAAADIVVGMGGSSLRGMAFGKPVIVVGEQGFSAPFTAETAEDFYRHGMYGRGDSDPDNARLTGHLRTLATDAGARAAIGEFSRRFAVERFSIEVASARLADLCHRAVAEKRALPATIGDALRTTAVYLRERRFLTASRDQQPVDAVSPAVR
jgi:L-malate glycosyltransferase